MQMANILNMERCSVLVIREKQIKTTRYHLTPARIVTMKNKMESIVGKEL